MSPPPGTSTPRPSATVLLLRDEPTFQVLMVRRHHQIDFATGALVFPGGKSHAGDADPRWCEYAAGWDELDPSQRPLRIAAIREAWEEAGVLLADARAGGPLREVGDMATRAAVDRGEAAFLDVVRELDARLRLDTLVGFARWITPSMMPKRFDTWFYAAEAPEAQVALCDGRETVDAEWLAPMEVLRLAAAGRQQVIFPTLMNVRLLAEARNAEDCLRRARERPLVPVLPEVVVRDGEQGLTLPPDAGYGDVFQRLADLP